ncbi:MAG: hypothetical protein ACI8PB_004103 [Desulforhopalus sp.]|jgi:hypothetical protein
MKIYCPHCGVKGSADDSYSGRTIKCPKCQEMFDLTTDMAIDPSEFLTVDLDSPVAALAESEEQVDGPLDLSEELGDVMGSSELAEDDVEPEDLAADEEDSIDWGDFGAALDKEIAESEAKNVTGDLLETDGLLEEDGPIASQGDADENPSLDDIDITEDNELAGDLGDILRGGPEDAEDVLEEVVEEYTDIDEEIAEPLAAEEDEILDTVDTVEAIEDTVEEDVDTNLGTLSEPDVVMPLFVDDETDEAVSLEFGDEEITDNIDSAEVLEFADIDLVEEKSEAEDEPDIVIGDDSDDVVVIEDEPYGLDKEQCWQCGKEDSVGEPFIAIDGRLYCTDCLPAEEVKEDGMSAAYAAAAGVAGAAAPGNSLAGDEAEDVAAEEAEVPGRKKTFTVGGVIRESWEKVKGIKASIWAGSALMYLVLIVIIAGGAFLLPETTLEPEGGGVTSYLLSALFQVVTEVVSMLFIAGLLFMGIRHVAGDKVSWKMIFHGFSFTGKIIVVSILQFILVTIGFLLLILPGIYLVVGYAMAIPLIVDKNLSPWEALETSRKAVHKVWWKVAALYIVMSLIFLVALIPLGIGLIWVWPMIMVAAGVVYHRLFRK